MGTTNLQAVLEGEVLRMLCQHRHVHASARQHSKGFFWLGCKVRAENRLNPHFLLEAGLAKLDRDMI